MIISVLDTWLVRLEEEGFVQALWANYTHAGPQKCSSASAGKAMSSASMSVVDFGGVIVLVAIFASVTFAGSLFFRTKMWRVRSRVTQVKDIARHTSRFAMERAPSAWTAVKKLTVRRGSDGWPAGSSESGHVSAEGRVGTSVVRFQDVVHQAGITHARAWAAAEDNSRGDDIA